MTSSPASSWARIASTVASSCASFKNDSSTRQSSRARTRGGKRPASFSRSISHSGCGELPTSVVGKSFPILPFYRAFLPAYEFGGNLPEPGRVDAPAALDIAPGEVARREPHVLGEPIVPVAARVPRRHELLHDRPARRFERSQCFGHFILVFNQGLRQCDGILHREPRPGTDREVRGAQGVADQHHVAGVPACISYVGEIPPYRLVRDETVPSQGRRKRAFTVLQRLRLTHPGEANAFPRGRIAFENERAHFRRMPVMVGIESPMLVLDKGLRQRGKKLRGAEPGELVAKRDDGSPEIGRAPDARV